MMGQLLLVLDETCKSSCSKEISVTKHRHITLGTMKISGLRGKRILLLAAFSTNGVFYHDFRFRLLRNSETSFLL